MVMKDPDKFPLIIFISLVIIAILVSVLILLHSPADKTLEAPTKPSIYITRTDSYRTLEGDILWVLEYTINGEVYAPMFNSLKAMTEYREYLDTIGKVYQREEQ
jgi:hypothetical protein